MATKKATSSAKKSTTKGSTSNAKTTTTVKTVTAVSAAPKATAIVVPKNVAPLSVAEAIGTFILTLVVLLSLTGITPLYVGLTLTVLVLAIGSISGAHVNPAVTFGLWSIGRVKSILLPFYFVAQFVGAMAAVVLFSALSDGKFAIDFTHFATFNWPIFFVELIGTAVFLFGVTAVTSKNELSAGAKALGVGVSLTIGILVASSLFATVQGAIDQSKITSLADVPHELRVKGATLNPAVALAVTENTDAQLQGSATSTEKEKQVSRLSLEVIFSTLIGGALGANLALLLIGRNKR